MAIVYVGPNYLTCLSSDTKPTNLPDNFIAYETDTDKAFVCSSSTWSALYVIKFDTTVRSGNGVTTVFTIAHGAPTTPTIPIVIAGSAAAATPFWTSVDSTNITITYLTAPVSASNNLTFYWFVA